MAQAEFERHRKLVEEIRAHDHRYYVLDDPQISDRAYDALYAELKAVTPDSLKPLLSDLFEHVTIWDVRTDSVKSAPVDGGQYRVTLFVEASKARSDSIGNLTQIDMNDHVEIGVFAGTASDKSPGDSLYVRQHRIRSGKQTIVITVPRQPARAGIDPYRKLIERERDDNVAETWTSPPK